MQELMSSAIASDRLLPLLGDGDAFGAEAQQTDSAVLADALAAERAVKAALQADKAALRKLMEDQAAEKAALQKQMEGQAAEKAELAADKQIAEQKAQAAEQKIAEQAQEITRLLALMAQTPPGAGPGVPG